MALEQISKKAFRAAKTVHPKISWFLLKKDGYVANGWKKTIKVEVDPTKPAVLWFDEAFVEEFKLDKKAIREQFERLAAASACTQTWSL